MWLALAALLSIAPAGARAEAFIDLYMGVGLLQDSDVETSADDPFVDSDIDYLGEVEWETSPSLGLRGGYWFGEYGPSFIGVGLDLSYYQAFEDSSFAELEVAATPMTPLLMLRIPLGYNEDYPGGRVQPYVAVGPGFTIAYAHAEVDEITPSNPPGCGLSTCAVFYDDFDEAGFGVGLDARAGLAIALGHHFALFGEYRYTYVEPEFEEDLEVAGTPFGFETEVEFEPELQTHHIVFGASFRF